MDGWADELIWLINLDILFEFSSTHSLNQSNVRSQVGVAYDAMKKHRLIYHYIDGKSHVGMIIHPF